MGKKSKKRKKKIEKLKEELALLEEEEAEEQQQRHPLAPILGSLGNVSPGGQITVQDRTTPDRNGESIPFNRPAGTLRRARFDGSGNLLDADVEFEEWPPRKQPGELF